MARRLPWGSGGWSSSRRRGKWRGRIRNRRISSSRARSRSTAMGRRRGRCKSREIRKIEKRAILQ
jgi:hypothetical protein